MFSVDSITPAVRSRLRPLIPPLSLLIGDHQLTILPKTGTCLRIPSCHNFSSLSFCKSKVAVSIPMERNITIITKYTNL